jgi:SAM-dependent methyltransferase
MRPGGLELTKRLLEAAAIPKGAAILDAGCGVGASVACLRGLGENAAGADPSEKLIALGLARDPALPLFTRFPRGACFDAVLMECVLSASGQGRDRLLNAAREALAPGGFLLVSDVYGLCPDNERMTKDWWLQLLKTAGFEPIGFEDHTEALRRFAAETVWRTGRRDALRNCLGFDPPEKPGYYICFARRPGSPPPLR